VSARRRVRPGIGLVVALLVILGGALYAHDRGSSPTSHSAPTSAATSAATPAPVSTPVPAAPAPGAGTEHLPAGILDAVAARAAVGTLRVLPKGSLTGYERDCGAGAGCVFGPAWADVDHNGCDTRNDVLHRDLTGIQVRPGTHDCVVVAGTLADPYTGTTVAFTKAEAGKVQIDHVVPLAAAWTQGAAGWTPAQREQFANDPGNLIATESGPNEAKGDDTADEWVPPSAAFGCAYARVIVTVKERYSLAVTQSELGALERLLGTC
jgi:Protein of unknown function (DUF1524)